MIATMAAVTASQKLRTIDAIRAWSLRIATNQRPLKPNGRKGNARDRRQRDRERDQ